MLSSVIDSLELLAAWQQHHSPAAETTSTSKAAPDDQPTADGAAVCQSAASATVSGIPKTSFTPFELHRQLREERTLTANLLEQVRQLQQKLVIAAQTAGSAAGRSMLSMSSDSVLRGSCITAIQNPADAADCADSAATSAERAAAQQQQQSVVVQLRIYDSADTDQQGSALAAAQSKIVDLQQKLKVLQEQLDVVTRERAGLQGRLASARTVLAAARCSTPSSLNSSRFPSPQPCFSPLRSFVGVSATGG